jgi:serine/threonine-protein kinase
MAPEQASGMDVDRRADIWALGATLYRALSGTPPLADRDELTAFIAGKPIAELPHTIDPALRAVVFRALEREPRDRFATAEDMRLALEEALLAVRASGAAPIAVARGPVAATQIAPRTSVGPRNRALSVALALSAVLVAAALALAIWGYE